MEILVQMGIKEMMEAMLRLVLVLEQLLEVAELVDLLFFK